MITNIDLAKKLIVTYASVTMRDLRKAKRALRKDGEEVTSKNIVSRATATSLDNPICPGGDTPCEHCVLGQHPIQGAVHEPCKGFTFQFIDKKTVDLLRIKRGLYLRAGYIAELVLEAEMRIAAAESKEKLRARMEAPIELATLMYGETIGAQFRQVCQDFISDKITADEARKQLDAIELP